MAIVMIVVLATTGYVTAQSPPSPPSPPPPSQAQPPSVADIKVLAKGGMSDEVILSQIRSSHAAYHLTTADILDLKDSGVSEKVIDFMINTASASPVAAPAPAPAPP